ncbi:MAG: hypothetical protein JWN32_4037, partial [Solirubrobacterales bacterium]|nr:hypothetical protein [Solirubrobacterales bacterium]
MTPPFDASTRNSRPEHGTRFIFVTGGVVSS